MRIIPIRGLNLRCCGHVDGGVAVECEEKEARELLALGMAERAPTPPPAAVNTPGIAEIETAAAPAAPETAALKPIRRTRAK